MHILSLTDLAQVSGGSGLSVQSAHQLVKPGNLISVAGSKFFDFAPALINPGDGKGIRGVDTYMDTNGMVNEFCRPETARPDSLKLRSGISCIAK